MKKRLAIITTHPIQYHSPLFELLAQRSGIDIRVFYTWGESVLENKFDPGFGKVIDWDIELLKGYDYRFLVNTSPDKGSHHFKGIINPDIIGHVKEYKPDAVLVFGWSFKSHLAVMRYFKGKVPVYFRGDSNLLDKKSFVSEIIRNIALRWVYRFVDIAFYVGSRNRYYYIKAGLKDNQLVFAPHAIDNARFACTDINCSGKADEFRMSLGIGKNDFVFLFAGKIEPKKDPDILLTAFTEAGLSPNVHLVIAGNGILEAELKKKYGNKSNVHFIGFQNQSAMPSLYKMADVFVLPSKGPGETWGLAVNEAMAAGKAVIVSDKCGCTMDLVNGKGNGFVFKSGDADELRDKIIYMCQNRDEVMDMQQKSLQVIKGYSLDEVAKSIENALITP